MTFWDQYKDLDGDGDADIILQGNNAIGGNEKYVYEYYLNEGAGTFTRHIFSGVPEFYNCLAGIGDLDGDSDEDLILTGGIGDVSATVIYKNDGSAQFVSSDSAVLPETADGCIALGDMDNDGDLDMILTGNKWENGYVYLAEVYENDGNGNFSLRKVETLTGVSTGTVTFADIDSDGDSDLILTGYDGTESVMKIYENHTE